MNALRLLVFVLMVMLTGCQVSPKAQADPAEYGLDEVFTLGGGRDAVIRGDGLRLRFTEVLEDSRCPARVECVWTGQARIAVAVQQAGQESTTAEFNTNPAPALNVQTARVGPFAIELQALNPYPQTPEESVALADYEATFSVRQT